MLSRYVQCLPLLVLPALLVVTGCGEEPAPPTPPETPETTDTPVDRAPTTASETDSTGPEPSPDSEPETVPASAPSPEEDAAMSEAEIEQAFEKQMAKARELERNTEFLEAMKLLQTMQRRDIFRQQPYGSQISKALYRLSEFRRSAFDLGQAVKKLTQDPAAARIARSKLINAGDVGALFLRKAMRESGTNTALAAAQILIELKDDQVAELLLDRLMAGRDEQAALRLVELLEASSAQINADAAPKLWRLFEPATKIPREYDMLPLADVVVDLWNDQAARDPATFIELTDRPGSSRALEEYVEFAAYASAEPVARWGKQHAWMFDCVVPGWLGRYYAGRDFEKDDLMLERLDPVLDMENEQFPTHERRHDHFSVKWTALFPVDERGKFEFTVDADDEGDLHLNDKKIIDRRGNATVELMPGDHPIEVRFREGGGTARIRVRYRPGGEGEWRWLDDSVVRTTTTKDTKLPPASEAKVNVD